MPLTPSSIPLPRQALAVAPPSPRSKIPLPGGMKSTTTPSLIPRNAKPEASMVPCSTLRDTNRGYVAPPTRYARPQQNAVSPRNTNPQPWSPSTALSPSPRIPKARPTGLPSAIPRNEKSRIATPRNYKPMITSPRDGKPRTATPRVEKPVYDKPQITTTKDGKPRPTTPRDLEERSTLAPSPVPKQESASPEFSYIKRNAGSKAISEGAVSPNKQSKIANEMGCDFISNDRIKFVDSVARSPNTNVNLKDAFKMTEFPGSGESRAKEMPSRPPPVMSYKPEDVKKACGISAVHVPVNVLMKPKSRGLCRSISRSPFDGNDCSEEPQSPRPVTSVNPTDPDPEDNTLDPFVEFDNTFGNMDSIEEVLPPPELQDVVSDPQIVDNLPTKVGSIVIMLESIEPPSLVESMEDLGMLSAQVTEQIEPEEVHHEVINVTREQTVLEGPVSSVDSTNELMESELGVGNNKEMPAVPEPSQIHSESNTEVNFSLNQEDDVQAVSDPYTLQSDVSDSEDPDIEGTFNGTEIAEIKNEPVGESPDIKPISSNLTGDEITDFQKIYLGIGNNSMSTTIQENILRLEQEFLPYMIEQGLRPELEPTSQISNDVEETEVRIGDHDLSPLIKIYPNENPTESLESEQVDPSCFRVVVPNKVSLLEGIRPLTYLATMTITNEDERALTYKVQALTPDRYRYQIKPFIGYLPGQGSVKVDIQAFFNTFEELTEAANDSFVVLIAEAPSSRLSRDDLKAYWKLLKDRTFDSVVPFKIENVEIPNLQPRKSQIVGDRTKDRVEVVGSLDSERFRVQKVNKNVPPTLDDIPNFDIIVSATQLNKELDRLNNDIDGFVTWGTVCVYLMAVAGICALVIRDVNSIVLPPEPEPIRGWFDWISFF